MNKSRSEVNYPVGTRVIVRSEGNEPLMIGHIVEWRAVGKDKSCEMPIVRDEKEGKDWYTGGVIRKYDEKLLEALKKLTYAEQWNVLAEFGYKK